MTAALVASNLRLALVAGNLAASVVQASSCVILVDDLFHSGPVRLSLMKLLSCLQVSSATVGQEWVEEYSAAENSVFEQTQWAGILGIAATLASPEPGGPHY